MDRPMVRFALFALFSWGLATPPACFLSCVSEVTRDFPGHLKDVTRVCQKEDAIVGCLVDICPFGNFQSARDHYIGTCLEHGRPTVTNPYPPPAAWPPEDYEEKAPKVHKPAQHIKSQALHSHSSPPGEESHISAPSTEKAVASEQWGKDHHATKPASSASGDPGEEFVEYSEAEPEEGLAYDPNYPITWEDTNGVDEDGDFYILRRPVNVPLELRDPASAGKTTRVQVRSKPKSTTKNERDGKREDKHEDKSLELDPKTKVSIQNSHDPSQDRYHHSFPGYKSSEAKGTYGVPKDEVEAAGLFSRKRRLSLKGGVSIKKPKYKKFLQKIPLYEYDNGGSE
ncbi:uncharacterized protein LODBEIA_P56140 [Lodderomyces beijingensis]|uniref:Extracellular membrane protein CFEM domain-containing protein n=1 Tax=Lodderomyces beijingensis TaxID=1775926 RepID=A0ABP0ZVK1_9ASCO